MCWVSGPPREKVKRLVSSAVFQDPEMWWTQEWRGDGELDQRKGSGDTRAVPHAAEPWPEWGRLISSLDLFENTEISGWNGAKGPSWVWGHLSCCSLPQTHCKTNISELEYRNPNVSFEFHFKIKGFEPAFGPGKRKRGSGPNQGWDKGVAQDRVEGEWWRLPTYPLTILSPFTSYNDPDEQPTPHCGLPSSTYLLPSPIPSSCHSIPLECSTLSLGNPHLSPPINSA